MNRLQKVLFVLAVAIALGASNALAQVTFTSTSGNRETRAEGITETVGEVVMEWLSGAGVVPAGSSIVITYSGDVTNGDDLILGTNVVCNDVAACPTAITTTGNKVTLNFGAGVTFGATDRITVVEIRVDASGVAGSTITAKLSGNSSAPATNSITFTQTTVDVADIVRPSLSVDLNDDGTLLLNFGAGVPVAVLTCNPGESSDDVNISIEIGERFGAALADEGQEEGFSDSPLDPNSGTTLVFIFKNVPDGFTIRPVGISEEADLSDLDTAFPGDGSSSDIEFDNSDFGSDAQQTADGDEDLEFEFEVQDSDTSTAEAFFVNFNIANEDGDQIPAGGTVGGLEVEVKLGPIGGEDADIVRFAENTQGEEVVANIADCQTYLLFSWNAYTGDGAYDTGFAINNSALDPVPLDTAGETGGVTLYFYRSGGGTNPAPVVIDSSVAPGETATYVLSQLGAPFTGYVIAVCNFRYGHGINFLSNFTPSGYAQGFQGLVLNNPRPEITESLGH